MEVANVVIENEEDDVYIEFLKCYMVWLILNTCVNTGYTIHAKMQKTTNKLGEFVVDGLCLDICLLVFTVYNYLDPPTIVVIQHMGICRNIIAT